MKVLNLKLFSIKGNYLQFEYVEYVCFEYLTHWKYVLYLKRSSVNIHQVQYSVGWLLLGLAGVVVLFNLDEVNSLWYWLVVLILIISVGNVCKSAYPFVNPVHVEDLWTFRG